MERESTSAFEVTNEQMNELTDNNSNRRRIWIWIRGKGMKFFSSL
jgi:hypothetical protein